MLLIVTLVALVEAACHRASGSREVRLAYHHPMVTLDPHGHNDAVTGAVLSSVYEGLVRTVPGKPVQPGLAESWERLDPRTWRLTLRHGVLFHDGRPLTAEDVEASLERARFDLGLPLASYLEMIESVDIVPERADQVEIRLTAPSPVVLERLAMVAIAPQLADLSRPLGTGPYRWTSGRERGPVELERFADYWGEQPAIDRVRVVFLETVDEQVAALAERSIDVLSGPRPAVLEAGAPRGWREIEIPAMGTVVLGLNVEAAPLSDPRVRRAIDLAIDRRALVQALFPRRGGQAAEKMLPVGVAGRAESNPVAAADAQRARELLEAAGVAPGTVLDLQCAEVHRKVVAPLVEALASIGLKLRPELFGYEGSYRRFTEAQSELFVFGWSFRSGDPAAFLVGLVHSRDLTRRLGLLNGTGYSNPQVDRAIEAIGWAESGQRDRLVAEVLNTVAADRPYLPLYHQVRLALVREPFEVAVRSGTWILAQEITR